MIKAAIIGASGYSGAELLRLLSNHKQVEITIATSKQYANKHIQEVYPNLITDIEYTNYHKNEVLQKSDVVFTALPHGISMTIVPELLDGKHKVIDISADYRLKDAGDYQKWYELKHSSPSLLKEAAYGLSELNKMAIEQASLVANPGCYPTGVILILAPLLKYQLVKNILVNSLSGISGAGAVASKLTHFGTQYDNVTAYKVGGVHQHIPEIEQELSNIAGTKVKIAFTPHLIPVSRGIYTTVCADLKKDYTTSELIERFQSFYQDSYFITVLEEGDYPELKAVLGSNYCHLGVQVDGESGKVFVMSVLDNLVKGAAGQAIQNMNLMFGFNEWEGLETLGLYP